MEALREALERSGETCFYIPLTVDLQSGCVLFLAEKDIYEQIYQKEEKKWSMYHDRMEQEFRHAPDAYEKAKICFNDSKTLKAICDKKKAAYDHVLRCVDGLSSYLAEKADWTGDSGRPCGSVLPRWI